MSIDRTSPSVKAEENIRPRVETKDLYGQIHDLHRKGASTAEGKGEDIGDRSLLSKCAERLQSSSLETRSNMLTSENSMKEAKVELIVHLDIDMPVVGKSSSEKQSDSSVADSLQFGKPSTTGFISLKRRGHRDLEEARADKRVKVDSNVGLSRISLNENSVDHPMPLRGVDDSLDTNPRDELMKDDLRPFFLGNGSRTDSTVVGFTDCGEHHNVSTVNDDQYRVHHHMEVVNEIRLDGGVDQNRSFSLEARKVNPDQLLTAVTDSQLKINDKGAGSEVQKNYSDHNRIVVGNGAKEEYNQVPSLSNGNDPEGSRMRTDLTDLLNDLSADSDDSEDLDEDEFEGGSDMWREPLCDDWMVNEHINEKEVQDLLACIETKKPEGSHSQANCAPPIAAVVNDTEHEVFPSGEAETLVCRAHTPQIENIAKAHNVSSEQAQRNGDIGPKVQVAHDTIKKENYPPEIVLLDSDSDDDEDLVIVDQPDKTSPSKNTVKVEPGSLGQLDRKSQLENAVKLEPGGSRQVPMKSSQLENAVKLELGSIRQVLDCDAGGNEEERHVFSSITASGGFQHTLPPVPHVLEDVRAPETNSSVELPASRIPFFGNGHSWGPPPDRSAPPAWQPSPESTPSGRFQALTMDGMLRAKQAGILLQTKVQGGKLLWGLAPQYVTASQMSDFASPGNFVDSRLSQVNGLPNALSCMLPAPDFRRLTGRPASFAPNNGQTQLSGLVRDNHSFAGQAVPGVPSTSQQAGYVHGATSSAEQASSSHGRNPPTTTAVVPYCRPDSITLPPQINNASGNNASWQHEARLSGRAFDVAVSISGASKAEPGLYDNKNLGPQNCPIHNKLAVVKPSYDSTVSSPRVEVARALQQYYSYISKAKNERRMELLARRASNSNEFTREGNSRGLECRPDIVAYNDIKKAKEDVNPGVNVGDLPGVEVGDRFTYRHQMAVVGLHRLPNVGIDYGYPPDSIITATAIVLMPKAGYVDDKDYGNTILYTGQGGRKKRNQAAPFVMDQVLKKGNLALVSNHDRKLPVRVIRGHSQLNSSGPGVLGYTYDGLYIITGYDFSAGINGYRVYKFFMERLEGQPPIPPCIPGCTAHRWNDARGALRAQPLQVMDPPPMDEVDVKQICGIEGNM